MNTNKLGYWLSGGVLFLVASYGIFLIIISWPFEEFDISSAGVFGDSFGVLTSLFSGLAFVGLIVTILMQREELSLQRKELALTREEFAGQKIEMALQNENSRIQNFENTFFKMMDLWNDCRNDISHGQKYSGREAINRIYKGLLEEYFRGWNNGNYGFLQNCLHMEGVREKYKDFYDAHGDDLGQYFITLFNILKFVDESDFILNKKTYANLIRAQISRYELTLLFYNCIAYENCEKMQVLVKKFNLLKHLNKYDIDSNHISFYENFIDAD